MRSAYLIAIPPNGRAFTHELTGKAASVGRDVSGQVVVDSRAYFRLQRVDDGWALTDGGSFFLENLGGAARELARLFTVLKH